MKSKLIKTILKRLALFIRHWPLILTFFIFALLLAKNPFSDRTLIPNFEPFPDTFYYIVTPRCWLQEKEWQLCREGASGIESSVAPLYGMSLLPFFILNNDPRMFYFANITFAFTGLFFFYLIIKNIFDSANFPKTKNLKKHLEDKKLIMGLPKANQEMSFLSSRCFLIFFILFLYATSYRLYWYPTLAMASNLLLPLFLLAAYLLIQPVSLFRTSLALALAGSFFATKFSALPLVPTYLVIYLFKILFQYKNNKKLLTRFILLFSFFTILILSLKNFYLSKLIYSGLHGLLFSSPENRWFSFVYFQKNLDFYLKTLVGQPAKVLWDFRPFYPTWVGIGAIVGLFWALLKKQGFALSALLLLAAQVIFMSLFYDHDGRYIFIALPVIFIGFTYFLKFGTGLFSKINKQALLFNGKNIFLFFISLVFLIYNANNFTRIKSQISLNLKYAEQPWYYLSVLEFNNFFAESTLPKKPILISAVAPFLIDFYSNNNYSPLPLSSAQEFRGESRKKIWGKNDYSDLIKLYKSKIDAGFDVYITKYGLENNTFKIADFKIINESFTLTKVHSGCHDQCNIYKLGLSPENH